MRWIALLLLLSACTVSTNDPIEAQVEIVMGVEYSSLKVYEDGNMCWHTNPTVPVKHQFGNRYFFDNMPDGNYCACWLDVPPQEFDFTLNGEPAVGRISQCTLFSLPQDGRLRIEAY